MAFGNFSSVDMPTDQGNFKIHVLPEFIKLGTKDGRPVYTFLEHYAMVPASVKLSPFSTFYVHPKNLYEDLFLPASKTDADQKLPQWIIKKATDIYQDLFSSAPRSKTALNLPQKILQKLNADKNGILLYTDALSPAAFGDLQKGIEPEDVRLADTASIVDAFSRHAEIAAKPMRVQETRPPVADMPSHFGKFDLHRLDQVVDVPIPAKALQPIFPEAATHSTIFRKYLSHFALVNLPHGGFGATGKVPSVRVHSSCATGDINAAHTCDCGTQYYKAMERIVRKGGAMIYDDAEGRGVHSLSIKMLFYKAAVELGLDTYTAMEFFGYAREPNGKGPDKRTFDGAAKLMKFCGLTPANLMTNNSFNIRKLTWLAIDIRGSKRVLADWWGMPDERRKYLAAKFKLGGHELGGLFNNSLLRSSIQYLRKIPVKSLHIDGAG